MFLTSLTKYLNTLYLSRAQAHSSPSLIGCLLVYATPPRTRSPALVLDLYSPRTFLRSRSSSLSNLAVYLYLIYASLQHSYRAISFLFAHNIFTKYLNKTLSNQIKIYPNIFISLSSSRLASPSDLLFLLSLATPCYASSLRRNPS